jgi:protein TonB
MTPAVAPPRSKWTIAGSFIAHLIVVLVMVIVPIVSTTAGPAIVKGLDLVVVPPPPTIPPSPPQPVTRIEKPAAAVANPDAAPVESGTRLTEEPVNVTTGRPTDIPSLTTSSAGLPSHIVQGPSGITLEAPPRVTPPIRPGGDVKPPQRTFYSAPVYPQIAQTARIEGTVILEAIIDESGVVRDVKVLRSIPLLDRAAIDAVSKWRYTPTRLNGTPISIIMTVTVTFGLKGSV